jgi:hypothetical protein
MSDFEDDYRPAVAELASEADRLWFRARPDRSHRLRQALVGENPGVTAEHLVVVRQSFRGLRFRWAFLCEKPLPPGDAPEWMARAFFERLVRERGLNVRDFERAIGASPVVMEALGRAADDPYRGHPLLPRQDARRRPSDA